jgi:hypothetical protein
VGKFGRGWTAISDYVTKVMYDKAHKGVFDDGFDNTTLYLDLQVVLAHEMEHQTGFRHGNGDPYKTPHSSFCGGL